MLGRVEIGLLEGGSAHSNDSSLLHVVDGVVESLQQAPLDFSPWSKHGQLVRPGTSKILVYGSCESQAQYVAERMELPFVASASANDFFPSGVTFCNLNSTFLKSDLYHAILVFNVDGLQRDSISGRDVPKWLSEAQHSLVPGGILAGSGVFQGLTDCQDGPALSVQGFRSTLERAGFAVHVTADLAIHGTPVIASHTLSLGASSSLVCIRYFATKIAAVDASPTPAVLTMASSSLSFETAYRRYSAFGESDVPQSVRNETFHSAAAVAPSETTTAPVAKRIGISGISLGLPNNLYPDHRVFDSSNFIRLLAGTNFISPLTIAEKDRMVQQNIVQVLKKEGKRVNKPLNDPALVLQVAGKIGHFDLVSEYAVPPHVAETLDTTYKLAVAAGLEALKNAGICVYGPDVPAPSNNASSTATPSTPVPSPAVGPLGTHTPLSGPMANADCKTSSASEPALKIIGLPLGMREDTGVIFASSFPCLDSLVEEVSKACQDRQEDVEEEEAEGDQVSKEVSKEPKKKKQQKPKYELDRKLLFKLLVMANSQLAELIHARGPNTHINSACSSTTQAIAMAEDWIRLGRCARVIVIAADHATSPNLMPYLGKIHFSDMLGRGRTDVKKFKV